MKLKFDSLEELITKKVKDNSKQALYSELNVYKNTFLSKPISLRIWSSFFIILPIFVQAPWVRFEPLSAFCFTFVILLGSFLLARKIK